MAEKKLSKTKPVFMAEDLFLLATSHEHHEISRYELLSLRFLTYRNNINIVLHEHAKESESRLQALFRAAERLSIVKPSLETLRSWSAKNKGLKSNFFIINDEMASEALNQALVDEYNTWDFYCQLRQGNSIPELDILLSGFVAQSLLQCRVIEESIEQLALSQPKNLASFRLLNKQPRNEPYI